MQGVITRFDILAHPILTIRCFGCRLFFRALFAKRDETFLLVLSGAGLLGSSPHKLSEAEIFPYFERVIQLELRAKRVYATLAETVASSPSAKHFFEVLASQEQEHADMMAVCRAATFRGDCSLNSVDCTSRNLSQLEQIMTEAEELASSISSLEEALRLVVRIEWSEINQVYRDVFSSSNSRFVHELLQCEGEIDSHIDFIVQTISEFAPQVLDAELELQPEGV
jgi:hypothetical protein